LHPALSFLALASAAEQHPAEHDNRQEDKRMTRSSRTRVRLAAVIVGLGSGLLAAPGGAGAGQLTPASVAPAAASALPQTAPEVRGVLDRYCVTCHRESLRSGGLVLEKLDLERAGEQPDVWEKVIRKLQTGSMPPAGARRPDQATYHAVTTWLENTLDKAAAAHPTAGRPPAAHRLNRAEYTNAIRDLLALDIDGRALLPGDESSFGFDNIGDVLTLSPALLERYMSAARKISRLAIGNPAMRPMVSAYTLPRSLTQQERVSDELPFRSRGGTVIRHHFPVDGEYTIKIQLQRTVNTPVIRGLANHEQLDVRVDGARVKLFQVGGECLGSSEPRCVKPPGLVQASEYERTADAPLQVRFRAEAGTRAVGIAFVRRSAAAPEGPGPVRLPPGSSADAFDQNAEMGIEGFQIEGPFDASGAGDTPSRRQIFSCRAERPQDEEPCARKILSGLARRAYRRPVVDGDVRTLIGFYRTGRASRGFEGGIELALERLLISPEFLLRIEQDPDHATPGAPYRISQLELASRLSFFLWSSIPDDELLELAAQGRLSSPAVLEGQVRRMLSDPRARALVTNFAGQWLYLRNMASLSPDPALFPDFDRNLRDAFQRETELFLESQLREDKSITELLSADYTFVNERLAKFYGIPNVYGNHFRRVSLPGDTRAGLLGQASILMVTSYANRTSPVLRGKWLLENILGSPPPPPPPNVPPLKENGEGGAPPATVRARMEEHRKNPICSSCHARMDPLGFALENFDAIGRWRATDAGAPIDASGVFPNGTKFTGPVELRRVLLDQRDSFVETLTEKLLTYALGRGLEAYDMPAVRAVQRAAAAQDYRWSALILAAINSLPFQMRSLEALPAATTAARADTAASSQTRAVQP
jgi:hypothetical protein